MATKKKLLQAAAGTAAAGGAGALNVEDVFSTYLYEGNGSGQIIENGINLSQSHGGGSINVPRGEDNNVTTSTNSGFAYGTGDFTWETWIMPQVDDGTLNTTNRYIFDHTDGSGGNLGSVTYYNGVLRYYNPTVGPQDSTQALSNYTWAHFAVCRSSGTTKMFYNGTQILSFSDSYNFAEDQFVIGDFGGTGATYSFGGLYSDVRVSNTARYTSNFTPPSSSFSSDSNTVLLTGQGSTIVDNSSNALTLTANGDAAGKSYGYYDAADAGEGGLVWTKSRTGSQNHWLYTTAISGTKGLISNDTASITSFPTYNELSSYNANGFTLGTASNGNQSNLSGEKYASWTFRKAPKFFDVVTYTGTGSATTISHNLGSVPAVIICKNLTDAENWQVYHKDVGNNQRLLLNQTVAAGSAPTHWNNTTPTSTEFTVGTHNGTNGSGDAMVAYLFAHNDGDGDFGPTGDQDIIKCGSVTYTTGATVDLGFEPQWVLMKPSSSTGNWTLNDVMRGMPNGSRGPRLDADTSGAEIANATVVYPTSTGFTMPSGLYNNPTDLIYIAIRRGPMAVPTAATDVFAATDMSSSTLADTGFPVDLSIDSSRTSSSSNYVNDRLRGSGVYLATDGTSAEATGGSRYFDSNDGVIYTSAFTGINWSWKRAPSFCDVVAYTGTGSSQTVSHNLGVTPEFILLKNRSTVVQWTGYHKDLNGGTNPAHYKIVLNETNGEGGSSHWNYTSPTSSDFTVGSSMSASSNNYIAYLFASLDGVSKVGSYTGSSSAQTIDCGFSSGARFVMIKNVTDSGTNWIIFDAERGIVSGNDPYLFLNANSAEDVNGSYDYLDPHSSGFTLEATNFFDTNDDGKTYIFYAVA